MWGGFTPSTNGTVSAQRADHSANVVAYTLTRMVITDHDERAHVTFDLMVQSSVPKMTIICCTERRTRCRPLGRQATGLVWYCLQLPRRVRCSCCFKMQIQCVVFIVARKSRRSGLPNRAPRSAPLDVRTCVTTPHTHAKGTGKSTCSTIYNSICNVSTCGVARFVHLCCSLLALALSQIEITYKDKCFTRMMIT